MGKESAPIPPTGSFGTIGQKYQDGSDTDVQRSASQNDTLGNLFQQNQDQANKSKLYDNNAMTTQADNAGNDRGFYDSTMQPLMASFAQKAQDWASPGRTAQAMANSDATVASQFKQSRAAAMNTLAGLGVDPSQNRSASMDNASRIQQAIAGATGATAAAQTVQAQGMGFMNQAQQQGNAIAGQANAESAASVNAANAGVNTGLSLSSNDAQTMGTGASYQMLNNQDLSGWGNSLSQGYADQMAQAQFKSQQSSGIGGLLGTVLGGSGSGGMLSGLTGGGASSGGGGLLSSLSSILAFSDGGMVPDTGPGNPRPAIPLPAGMDRQGGPVPVAASPSRGQVTDDVPARLNAGEYVHDKDTVAWFGEKHMQAMAEKARKEKAAATAKPAVRPAVPMGGNPGGPGSRPMPTMRPPAAVHAVPPAMRSAIAMPSGA